MPENQDVDTNRWTPFVFNLELLVARSGFESRERDRRMETLKL